jgi:hypothetical protein
MTTEYETIVSNNKAYTLPSHLKVQDCHVCKTICVRNRHHYPHWVRSQVERLSHYVFIPSLEHRRPVCATCALKGSL